MSSDLDAFAVPVPAWADVPMESFDVSGGTLTGWIGQHMPQVQVLASVLDKDPIKHALYVRTLGPSDYSSPGSEQLFTRTPDGWLLLSLPWSSPSEWRTTSSTSRAKSFLMGLQRALADSRYVSPSAAALAMAARCVQEQCEPPAEQRVVLGGLAPIPASITKLDTVLSGLSERSRDEALAAVRAEFPSVAALYVAWKHSVAALGHLEELVAVIESVRAARGDQRPQVTRGVAPVLIASMLHAGPQRWIEMAERYADLGLWEER